VSSAGTEQQTKMLLRGRRRRSYNSTWKHIDMSPQRRDKYSSAVSQAEKQKTYNLKGGHGHGRSSCTPPGKPACSSSSLKCLYSNA